jgi:hypothetical protein
MRITIRGVRGWMLPHQVGIESAYDQFVADADALAEYGGSAPVVAGTGATADD